MMSTEPITAAPRTAAVATRQAWLARVRRFGPIDAVLIALITVSAVVLAVQAPATITQLYRNADQAAAIEMVQLARHAPPGTLIGFGDHPWDEAWWFMAATRGLPAHIQIWEAGPFALAVIAILLVCWSTLISLGRRAALMTAAALLSIGVSLRPMWFVVQGNPQLVPHIALLMLALLAVHRRAARGPVSRPWLFIVGGVLAIVTAAAVTDLRFVPDGLLPFVAAPLMWWLRVRARSAKTVMLFSLSVASAALIGGELLSEVMHDAGFRTFLTAGRLSFTPVNSIPSFFGNALAAWATIADGSFGGALVNRAGLLVFALGVLALLALGAAMLLGVTQAVAWWRAGTRRHDADDPVDSQTGARKLFIGFWSLSLAGGLSSYVLIATIGYAAGNFRELLPAWVAVSALLGALAVRQYGRWALTTGVILFALITLRDNLTHGVLPYPPAYSQQTVAAVQRFVTSHGAVSGYAGYYDSYDITVGTNFGIDVYPVWPCPSAPHLLCHQVYGNVSSWYDPKPHTRTFVITDPGIGIAQAPPSGLGHPIATARFAQYSVYIYDHDVAAQLSSF